MNRYIALWLVIFSFGLLGGCSGGEGASDDQIANTFALQLPTGLEVDDVEIQVSENIGSEVEPQYRARSKVTLSYTEDFYQEARVRPILSKPVVRKVAEEGDTVTGTLITSSFLRGESWDVRIDKKDFPPIYGLAESQYGVDGFVLEGSDEHNNLLASHEEEQAKAAAARAKKQAEEAAALRDKIAHLRGNLTGIWAAKQPALHNNAVWSSRNGEQLGIQLEIGEGENTAGTGVGILYDYNNPSDEITVPIAFSINRDGEAATIIFNEPTQHKSLQFSVNPRYKWKFTTDGMLQYNASGNKWSLSLEKDGEALQSRLTQVASFKEKQKIYEELISKHKAFIAKGKLSNLNLKEMSYAHYFVTGEVDGPVYGSDLYQGESDVSSAVVHSGVLKAGQSGVVKISRYSERVAFSGTLKNGVTSEGYRYKRTPYKIELVEGLSAK